MPLFAQDFLIDTIEWSNEEIGIYIRLLCYEWTNGDLPADEKELAKIVGLRVDRFTKLYNNKVRLKFDLNGTYRLINLRLEKERNKLLTISEQRKLAAEKRWKK